MDLDQNHFQIFDVPARFDVDLEALETRYRELQREVHPDRFARASQAEQRVSMQLATRVNEAYQTLKSPVARAGYLLTLQGVDPEFETNTAMPPEFLADQMEKRELLEQAVTVSDWQRVIALSSDLRLEQDTLLARIERQLEAQGWNEAAQTLRQLKFLEKFGEEIGAAEEKMDS
ncbi:MAG TPA: Fe-S protein assembly co-chaperone HscB [Burkholderiales bacterium]|jgi:molecular chaperone HscB|nr:Fe-S protein assembly co-chaperone HscB [Burkholderiales bacterium]